METRHPPGFCLLCSHIPGPQNGEADTLRRLVSNTTTQHKALNPTERRAMVAVRRVFRHDMLIMMLKSSVNTCIYI